MRLASSAIIAALACLGTASAGFAAPPGFAAQGAAGPSLDEVIERFSAAPAPGQPEASVRMDAWVERSADGGRAVVIVVEPEGDTKLIADPGITVTPAAENGVEWRVPLPHRLVDTEQQYFDPRASVRLPFDAQGEGPIELTVEYAYCVVDYQCFFGEEDLTVANRID